MNKSLMFIYNGKLRIVTALSVRRGRFGRALLVAENRLGKIKSFDMAKIVPLTEQQQAVLDGELAIR